MQRGDHSQVRIGITRSRYRIEQYHIDLLPVGGFMFTVYQDPRLFENVFWTENIDLRAFATCDQSCRDNERCIR